MKLFNWKLVTGFMLMQSLAWLLLNYIFSQDVTPLNYLLNVIIAVPFALFMSRVFDGK